VLFAGRGQFIFLLFEASQDSALSGLGVLAQPGRIILARLGDIPDLLLFQLYDVLLAAGRQFILVLLHASRHTAFSRLYTFAQSFRICRTGLVRWFCRDTRCHA
jgi:hypothetical protein